MPDNHDLNPNMDDTIHQIKQDTRSAEMVALVHEQMIKCDIVIGQILIDNGFDEAHSFNTILAMASEHLERGVELLRMIGGDILAKKILEHRLERISLELTSNKSQ